ncbi:hypothetical protein PHYSODRAFT_257657 [Phytophthora sojae]|uniref:Uncharacterized protein n=1 Tax=Phytophthora sojae (strain P6497) TaxID=1094619 RepID=G4YEE9_PHYSP|nr:hypothetical protein PHYSODRAFT_257657 [Phytophthora sojae]EGZ26856.1 hypothetical protein PHYSODRAFT_257657 [Phytophthora sojae]|eukprot:XP_009514131.1 hypothetical protein PHYSODRAFT_257657 [Phytophthora sojae]
MTTPGRTLCFECDRGGRDAAIEATEEPTLKRARVEEPSVVEVRLVEHIRDLDEANEDNDKHYGLFVWPSALLLSRFVAREADRLCRDKVVLELGCGTGLPSILAALCGATKVYLTDRADAADIQLNAEANIKLNKLEGRAEFIPLTWGDMHISDEVAAIFKTVDVVLAADCFYQSEDFEKVIATVALIFRYSASTSCKFVFSYQLRSINRSIAPLLSRWGLTAKSLDKSELFSNVDDVSLQEFDSIFLYEAQQQAQH